MIVFKILLIILISAPVVGLGWILYAQVNKFVRRKNAKEKQLAAEIRRRRV